MIRMPPAPNSPTAHEDASALVDAISRIVIGKPVQIRLAVACLLARGHLLIEDVPGVGKTTLAHALARAAGLGYQRVQFTSDLLPSDVLGVSVFDRERGGFEFHPGPVFSQLVLADEINRATPRTQSALLEAMEEYQVTIDGVTRALPEPFFVVATQNPQNQLGTHPLPESQLDRFLMRISLGYPDAAAERELLSGADRRETLRQLPAALDPARLLALQVQAAAIHAAPPIVDYVQALLDYSRRSGAFRHGLSPRAGLALLRAARAWVLLDRRNFVEPEDIQAVLGAVACHRLATTDAASAAGSPDPARLLIAAVAVP
jgi:MoxR-like ATPase